MVIKIIKNVGAKKKYLVAIMTGVCLVFGNFVGCASSTDEVTGTADNGEKVTLTPVEEAPAVEEDVSDENPKVFLGDSFTVYYTPKDGSGPTEAGLEVTVTDIGSGMVDGTILDKNIYYVYVELDIKNVSDQEDNVTANCFNGFYGDDYTLETESSTLMGDTLYGKVVMPGRKVKGRYYAFSEDISQYSVIEMEFGGSTIVVKDSSMVNSNEMSVPENVDTSELTYGTYVYHDTEHGNINTAEVGFASGEGANYIYIDCRGEGGHGVIEFVGYFQEANEDNSFTAIQSPEDYFEAEIRCTFVGGGLNVEVVSSEYDELYNVNGYYELESALNLDEVG